jgi:hypothetical protein
VLRALRQGVNIEGHVTFGAKTVPLPLSVANAVALATVLPKEATLDDLGLPLDVLLKRIAQVEQAVATARAGSRMWNEQKDLRARSLAFMHVLAPELARLDPALSAILVDARLTGYLNEMGIETSDDELLASLEREIAGLKGVSLSRQTLNSLGAPGLTLTHSSLNVAAERMLNLMLTSEGIPSANRPNVTVVLHDRMDYLQAYQKSVRTPAFGKVPLAFIEGGKSSYVIHVQGGNRDAVLTAVAHEMAHAVLSGEGQSLAKTGETMVESLVQRSMPKDMARLSLLGFLEEIKAFHGKAGADVTPVRLWLGYQLTALIASRMAVGESSTRLNWETLRDADVKMAASLRDLANLPNVRVLLVAASELLSSAETVNEEILGRMTQLSGEWNQNSPESPLNVVVVDNLNGGMPGVLSARLAMKGEQGLPLFTVMSSDEVGVAVTPLAGESYGAIDFNKVGALLMGLLGQAPAGVRVLTGQKELWKNLLAEAMIGIKTAVEDIKKALEKIKVVSRAA